MKTPSFEGPQATSFSYQFASSLKNSQVIVPRRRMTQLARRGIRYCPPIGSEMVRLPPFTLVVSPNGQHGILGWKTVNDLLEPDGCAFAARPGDVVALDDVLFLGGTVVAWDKGNAPAQRTVGRDAAARRIDGERFAAVAAYPQVGQVPMAPQIGVEGGRRVVSTSSADWFVAVKGRAIAAIGADFTSVIAFESGTLQVWLAQADAEGRALLGAESDVGFTASWVSIIGPHIMLVARVDGGSRLHSYTGDAKPLYSVTVPFDVLQPAIAGAGERVYLAGKGLAALDGGNVKWSHASDEPMYVSSFADGSLAVATGKRLDFLKPDGTVDQTFNTEEPLVAPPAIAGDGSVWVASAEALYVAR